VDACRTSNGPCLDRSHSRAIRSRPHDSAGMHCVQRKDSRAGSERRASGHSWRVSPRTACCRSTRRLARRLASCSCASPPGWLGLPARRRAATVGCTRGAPSFPRGRHCHEYARALSRRTADGACRAVRSVSEAVAADRWRLLATLVLAQAGTVSLRDGGVQSGLGVRRADPLARRGVCAGGDHPCGWHAARDRLRGAAGLGRHSASATVRDSRASRRCSIHHARRWDVTRHGRTAMSHMHRASRC
jgi:hypothetical protein